MKDFIKHFIRDSGGGWLCISSTVFNGPEGRIQVTLGSVFMPGTNLMGIDLAQLLDEQQEKEKRDGSRV